MIALQETVAVPDPLMTLGVIGTQVRPVGTVSARPIDPVNDPIAFAVIVVVPEVPAFTVTDEAEMLKSATPTVNVAVAKCESEPDVPIIVTAYVLASVAVHERVPVPEFVTLFGVISPQVKAEGMVSVSETFPANPLTTATVIVEVKDEPWPPLGEVATIVKSVSANVVIWE